MLSFVVLHDLVAFSGHRTTAGVLLVGCNKKSTGCFFFLGGLSLTCHFGLGGIKKGNFPTLGCSGVDGDCTYSTCYRPNGRDDSAVLTPTESPSIREPLRIINVLGSIARDPDWAMLEEWTIKYRSLK